MKKSIIFKSLIVLFSIISFVSCETEPLDSELDLSAFQNALDPNNPNNPNNNNNPPGTSTGDYWPRAVNNQWVFQQTGTSNLTYKMVGTDMFNNQTYYRFDPVTVSGGSATANGAVSWLNKTGANYSIKYDDISIGVPGFTGTITGFEVLLLKDDLAVNETWTGSYTQTTTYSGVPPINQTTNYTGTILARDVTETVNGETFTNVLKSKLVQITNIQGSSTTTTTEYWFSKDIGPIKTVTTSTGGAPSDAILIDYMLF